MIYVHTYYTGKFNSVKHVRVYDTFLKASKQMDVLGGTIKACEVIKEYKLGYYYEARMGVGG
ncbi:hypothetical protein [Escherichia phage BEK6]|nr:hypothetical protein [Escherichia phage BEK6]